MLQQEMKVMFLIAVEKIIYTFFFSYTFGLLLILLLLLLG
jgi:hypothetical protein